ncbi:probable Protein BFR2 [Ustilago trichophora]|uniref:Protein BFR2 n=1 Tax=Ustilago trichophora TaxID=86804 RepID=A0A5C3EKL7_9BASI|nr:probable Protein BFR2 [Ustilago trichophora]
MPPKTSLASLLGTLTNAAPVDFDPEALDADQAGPSTFANGNDSASGSEDNDEDEDEDGAGAGAEEEGEEEYMNPRAHYAEVGPSDMRKKAALSENDKINDARYQGVKSSRAELYADDDEDEEEELDGESEDGNDDDDDDEEEDSEEDEEMEQEAPTKSTKQLRFADDASFSSSSSDRQDDLQPAASTTTSIAAQIAQSASQAKALKARRLEDAEKGRQVRKQIKTFERALETRIKAQSVLREVNRLPDPAVYTEAISSSSTAIEPAILLLEQLLELSETLFSLRTRLDTLSSSGSDHQDGAVAAASTTRKRKRDFDVTVPEDQEEAQRTWAEITSHDQIDATLNDIATYSAAAEPHRREVLDKWSLKVSSAAAATAAASNGNKFTQLRAVNQTPSSQIDTVLAGDGLSRLISRTQVLRTHSEGHFKLGRSSTTTSDSEEIKDVEVFDDSDFYSTLLKELIERRSGVSSGAGAATTAAMMLSGLNGGKKKKSVDTRASKGRKLRYEVNEKIVNFMPPIRDRVRWGEDQIERLFRQLASSSMQLVKQTDSDYDEKDAQSTSEDKEEEAQLAGLRVFG